MFDATDYGPYSGLVRELEEAGLRVDSTRHDWCPECLQDFEPQISGWLGDLEVCISFCERSSVWDMQITQFVDGWDRRGVRRFRTEDRSDMAMMVRALRDANKGKAGAQQELPEVK